MWNGSNVCGRVRCLEEGEEGEMSLEPINSYLTKHSGEASYAPLTTCTAMGAPYRRMAKPHR